MIELEFPDISVESKGAVYNGRLKLADHRIIFRNGKTDKSEEVSVSDIELANWIKIIGKFGVRMFLNNGILIRYLGFKESDQDKITKFFKVNYDIDLQPKELSVRGWNWGIAKFTGGVLNFELNNVPAFDIALSNVSQCTTGKNEVTLEFHQTDDAPVSLMEMRFHIPSSELAGAPDPVEEFQRQVVQQARVMSISGDEIAIFREIHCLTPRGRYDIKVFLSFFQLHGKTFDYKVPMSTVIRIFLLPHKDGRQHFLVVSLDPPIKQGQTRYHFLVLSFNQDDETSLELPFSEEEIATKYEGKITKELSGPTYEVIGKIFKILLNKKITTPGAFKGKYGTPAISCSFKAAAGYLYPLERGFIYVHKPPIYLRLEEISYVNFARSGGSTKSFDFEVELKSGVVHTFSNIEKEEQVSLYNFIAAKKVKIKKGASADQLSYADSDGEVGPSDAYLVRVKREGEEKDEDDDDDESTDEDFNPGSANESDVAEEYDSKAESESDDVSNASSGDESKPKKVKKEKKEEPKKSKSESDKLRKKKNNDQDKKPKKPPSAFRESGGGAAKRDRSSSAEKTVKKTYKKTKRNSTVNEPKSKEFIEDDHDTSSSDLN